MTRVEYGLKVDGEHGRIDPCAVTTEFYDAGQHCGIAYWDHQKNELKQLHMADHNELKVSPAGRIVALGKKSIWVRPPVNPLRLKIVRGYCMQIERKLPYEVPYAFRITNQTRFTDTGDLLLVGQAGLTCATLVVAVFASTGLRLVDIDSWIVRAEDAQVISAAILRLKSKGVDPLHVQKMVEETPCIRIRPDEVGGAALESSHPVEMSRAVQMSAELRSLAGAV